MQTVLIALAAYLLGSISFAIVTSKVMRLPDPRNYGSKNPGATSSAERFTCLTTVWLINFAPPWAAQAHCSMSLELTTSEINQ